MAVTIRTADITGQPVGFNLAQHKEVCQKKLLDAKIALGKLKDYASDATTITEVGTVLTNLATTVTSLG